MKTVFERIAALLLASGLGACATFDLSRESRPLPIERAASSCGQWLSAMDEAVARSGVGDAGTYRVPAFPYLRVDRFTASFAQAALSDGDLFETWAAEARVMDHAGRSVELLNLPAAALSEAGASSREMAAARTESCANELMAVDFRQPAMRALAIANARVPDDYIDLNRVAGLYPIARPFFAAGVERWHADAVSAFSAYAARSDSVDHIVRYAPAQGRQLAQFEVAELLQRSRHGHFNKLILEPSEIEMLFAAFAPVFEVESGGAFDAVGALAWDSQGHPAVNPAMPIVYRRLAYTRVGGDVLPQLVYTAWFPERPKASGIDVLAGNLDGLVFRVTLALNGMPLLYDSIHPCGCYHMFFPTGGLQETPSPRPGDEWSFVPARAPVVLAGQRVVLHVQSRTHYLTGIRADYVESAKPYELENEDLLLSLPLGNGERRSIYGPDGLIAGSERPERMLFWPMGVPSAGTMRQWGHHATAFLGRRHFDDADLMERRFSQER